MVEKRKRPIEPTAKPGEEAVSIEANIASEPGSMGLGGGHMHEVQLESEEVELRQPEMREATESNEAGFDERGEIIQMRGNTQALSPKTETEFNEAVENLDPERQRESIMKRKRAA
jgi:hypothetical protein